MLGDINQCTCLETFLVVYFDRRNPYFPEELEKAKDRQFLVVLVCEWYKANTRLIYMLPSSIFFVFNSVYLLKGVTWEDFSYSLSDWKKKKKIMKILPKMRWETGQLRLKWNWRWLGEKQVQATDNKTITWLFKLSRTTNWSSTYYICVNSCILTNK